jgi:hypothetical protein
VNSFVIYPEENLHLSHIQSVAHNSRSNTMLDLVQNLALFSGMDT